VHSDEGLKSVPFNRPYMNGKELFNISTAYQNRLLAGDGPFTKECQSILSTRLGGLPVYLTQSGTAALELCLLSLNLNSTDEVIVPSFTFVSCANAVLIAGGTPVFADISECTQNLSFDSVVRLINENTKAIIIVHYAGICSELTEILYHAKSKGIIVIEDAAHCLGSTLDGRELGTFGDFGCFSFHETKNITCGEGGALVVRDIALVERIETIREKGTDRSRFLRGEVDKYTWRSCGSSYLPSEVTAAFLRAQLDDIDVVTTWRANCWKLYHELFKELESANFVRRPHIPDHVTINGHIYYLILPSLQVRHNVITSLKRLRIQTTFHYVPLHNSPFGMQFRHDKSGMKNSLDAGSRLVRLPMWFGLSDAAIELVANSMTLILKSQRSVDG